jgi:phospholipid/cholesterol/gamma-HCH transport system permease protein
MIPCLIAIAGFLGIWGGLEAGSLGGILSREEFIQGLRQEFKAYNVFFALFKAFVFAFIISTVPSYYGYNVQGGALEIGKASTTAVVVTCVLILFMDYLLAAILL